MFTQGPSPALQSNPSAAAALQLRDPAALRAGPVRVADGRPHLDEAAVEAGAVAEALLLGQRRRSMVGRQVVVALLRRRRRRDVLKKETVFFLLICFHTKNLTTDLTNL